MSVTPSWQNLFDFSQKFSNFVVEHEGHLQHLQLFDRQHPFYKKVVIGRIF
jgi:hypothetical protein